MDDADLYSLLGAPDEPTAQQRAQAIAAALRGQQASASRDAFLGSMGRLTGSAGLEGVGQDSAKAANRQYASAEETLQQIPKVAEVRLQRAIEKQKADQLAKYQDSELSLKRRQLEQTKFAPLAPGGQVYDTRTGELGAISDVPKAVAGGSSPQKAAALDKALRSFREDVDPSSGRGAGLFGKDQALVTSADKVLALIDDGKGGRNFNLTVRQVPELVQSVASMLSSGNQAAQAQLEHLMPKSWGGNMAERMEYITGHPQDAKLGEFVKQYTETAEREKKLAKQRIRDVQVRRLPLHQGAYSVSPAEFKAAAKQYLPDLSDDELDAAFKGDFKAPAPAEVAVLPADQHARLMELRAKRAAGSLK